MRSRFSRSLFLCGSGLGIFWLALTKEGRAETRGRRSGLIHHPRTIIDAMTSRARFLEPMMCRAVSELPQGPAWSYEVKFDAIAGSDSGRHATRGCCPATVVISPSAFRLSPARWKSSRTKTLIDEEIVAFDRNGRASFNQLQNHACTAHSILFYAFDRGSSLYWNFLEWTPTNHLRHPKFVALRRAGR